VVVEAVVAVVMARVVCTAAVVDVAVAGHGTGKLPPQ